MKLPCFRPFLDYMVQEGILHPSDYEYAMNRLLRLFRLDYTPVDSTAEAFDYSTSLETFIRFALHSGLIENELFADHFEAEIMDCVLPRPSEINHTFREMIKKGPRIATQYFYHLSVLSNYIKTKRIAQNHEYRYQSRYGLMQITINLSKPEKDPMLIAKLRRQNHQSTDYPKCALCIENVGFYGSLQQAPRSNHRVIDLTLNREKNRWALQYSPYAYFPEHCIVLHKEHKPMKVDHQTFLELIDFVDQFPHYLIGSNAGLPIVGGSILDHYHFQGGRHQFPIFEASPLRTWKKRGISVSILDWPMSVIEIVSDSDTLLYKLAVDFFDAWKVYENSSLGIFAKTDEEHNTMTPILRLVGSKYHLYLVLRNNYATKDRPFGHYHPREAYFHIKKENIGLIEVMGLAILPGRLKQELALLQNQIMNKPLTEEQRLMIEKHQDWVSTFQNIPLKEEEISVYLENQVGEIFVKVLEDCGVFKSHQLESFFRFVEQVI